MDDLSNIFEEADRYLHTTLGKWRAHLPELWEDAYQEGMIQVWRDVESGVDGGETTKLKILRRAKQRANGFFHRNGEYFYGKPPKSRDGIRRNGESLEKVQVFLEEYLPVHDWVYPTAKHVADCIGLTPNQAEVALRNIKTGNIDHMKYRDDGRKDWDYYSEMSVELLGSAGDDPSSNRSWTDAPDVQGYAVSFEDELVANHSVIDLIKKLQPNHQKVLYYYLYEGYTPTDIARMNGTIVNANAIGNKTFKSAISQLQMLMDPYHGECTAGHKRTLETSVVKKREDGYYIRMCSVCRTNAGGVKIPAKHKKSGRPTKTVCPKGHQKDQVDSHGRLRCSKCRAEAQRRYTQKRRDEGTS